MRTLHNQIKKQQSDFMQLFYSTMQEAQAAWESRQGVKMMPEVEEAGALEICLDYDIFEGRE